jgi:4'-phosphopantetheinyl transferase EntD
MHAASSLLRTLFPSTVTSAAAVDTEGSDSAPLYPEEAAHIARAVDKRRREFALGRACARSALAALGVAPGPLPSLPDRSVAWPAAAWGSITHTEGLCAAVAVRRSDAAGIGVDVEVRGRVGQQLWRHIATERERRWLDEPPAPHEKAERATRLFSAKEAFYKAQYCVSRAWVGFHDVELTLDDDGVFTVELVVDVGDVFRRGTRFSGRVHETREHVLSGLIVSR